MKWYKRCRKEKTNVPYIHKCFLFQSLSLGSTLNQRDRFCRKDRSGNIIRSITRQKVLWKLVKSFLHCFLLYSSFPFLVSSVLDSCCQGYKKILASSLLLISV